MAMARKSIIRPNGKTSGGGTSTPLLPIGDRVAREQPTRAGTPTPVLLRVPPDLLQRIDRAVETRRIKTPRHPWMLEALLEQLERDAIA